MPTQVVFHVHVFICVSPRSCSKEDTVEVVSQPQDEEEAPEEPGSCREEVAAHEQPGQTLLELTHYSKEPQALGFQRAQTPEAVNGGSHHGPSQKGVCVWV